MIVKEGGPLIGRSIEQAGLRHLPGVYLIEIDRMGVVLPAVGPQEVLQANDRLVFAGIVDSVVELHKIRGLEPATDQVFKLNAPRSTRCLVEAVVSASCPIVGRSIREGRFRGLYNAVVIAVARGGERINRKIGDIVLRAGDTLLLEAHPSFADSQRNSRDFFLVSRLENSNPPRHERILVSIGILVAMIIAASTGWLTMFQAALAATGLMIATRCCSAEAGIRNIEIRVLLAIAASFGIGAALQSSGVAQSMSEWITALAPSQPVVALALVYAVTLLLTELITNNAAAVLMFPIALATSHRLGVDFKPFAVVLMMAASHGYATPLGYQTHLMVYGPGGYRFSDFMRIGVPLDILIAILTIAIVPFAWPFQTAG
jgi:di/tricarboxylate transporter